jgi:hypothetical protein
MVTQRFNFSSVMVKRKYMSKSFHTPMAKFISAFTGVKEQKCKYNEAFCEHSNKKHLFLCQTETNCVLLKYEI